LARAPGSGGKTVDPPSLDLLRWNVTGHLNTVRDIARYDSETDTTTGVNHLVYDAYGNVTSETNSAVESLFLLAERGPDWVWTGGFQPLSVCIKRASRGH